MRAIDYERLTRQYIEEHYKDMTLKQIAYNLGLGQYDVRKIMKKMGIKKPLVRQKGIEIETGRLEEVLR